MTGPVLVQPAEGDVANEKHQEALRLFDKATEKEQHGLMAEAVKYYRRAFKLNPDIDRIYREHKLPNAHAKLVKQHGKNVGRKIDRTKLEAIDVDALLASFATETPQAPDPNNPDHHDDEHIAIKFANLGLDNHEEYAEVPPVSILTKLPSELWIRVLVLLIEIDPEAWFTFGISCKKHAYYAFHSSQVWKRLCYMIYPLQSYEENKSVALGETLPIPMDPASLILKFDGSWKKMLCQRPFIKLLGCYISVVNYYSEGGRAELSTDWGNPVRTITYYRYLRFYPHGECIMALTRFEPTKVIPQFLRNNKLKRLLKNPESRDLSTIDPSEEPHKIFHGKWTISGGDTVHIEVNNGSVPYYDFHYYFQIRNLGGVPNNSKLTWINFHAIWKRTPGYEEREGETVDFNLKNEKDFKFLRVRLYSIEN